jgi:hypothetical protein
MSRRSMTAVTQGSPPIEFPALAATGKDQPPARQTRPAPRQPELPPSHRTDRDGNLIEVEDDQPIPDGCRLVISPLFMDSVQRAVAEDTRREREEHDGDDGEHADADELRRAQAYDQYRRSPQEPPCRRSCFTCHLLSNTHGPIPGTSTTRSRGAGGGLALRRLRFFGHRHL